MRIFISGGCKNGKSLWAQTLAAKQRTQSVPLYYVATMQPADAEDEARIARHLAERSGWGFETVECARDISMLSGVCCADGSFLLDSLTALLANEMFSPTVDVSAPERVYAQLEQMLNKLKRIVIVSDAIFCEAARYDPLTDRYRKGLAYLDRLCAARCDAVIELCAGSRVIHKGAERMRQEGLL